MEFTDISNPELDEIVGETAAETLREELETNPFLRESELSIVDHLDMANLDPISRFAKIRALKDNF